MSDLSREAVDAALQGHKDRKAVGEQLEAALEAAVQFPISIEELKVFGMMAAQVPDGRRAVVITLPTGHQLVAPMVRRNCERVANELLAGWEESDEASGD